MTALYRPYCLKSLLFPLNNSSDLIWYYFETPLPLSRGSLVSCLTSFGLTCEIRFRSPSRRSWAAPGDSLTQGNGIFLVPALLVGPGVAEPVPLGGGSLLGLSP